MSVEMRNELANQQDEPGRGGVAARPVGCRGPIRRAIGDEPTTSRDADPGRELRGWADLRAADADREYVVGQLGRVYAEGRIDVGELDERMTAAWAARTYGELAALTADLPFVVPAHPTPGPDSAAAPPDDRPGERWGASHDVPARSAAWAALGLINLALWGGVAGAGIILLWWLVVFLAACALLAASTSTSSRPKRR